ncbi:hypothetical protein BTR14_13230 [Rhizobium rhizosphaerae]|uniref:AAA+ ATPase domain-containing protein n=1 Tax=Xaviernesmea rhizosphaerae TaxID=1672749 RepID=A0ABX3PCU5_9HYPH|nr:ATP-binding protein [Xaviernesmea rhizosphaerae]OQP86040.1 hypothetical protein BTR14_13230 [Xaviernesmea rhizosphaerae]
MSKLASLFVHRLQRIARREAQRNAHRNGLLHLEMIEIGGHVVRRYRPAFDTSNLSGDIDLDLAWLHRTYGGYLLPLPETPSAPGSAARAAAVVASLPTQCIQAGSAEHLSAADHAHRAYAVRLVGLAGRGPLISNVVAATVLSSAIENSRHPFAKIMQAATMSAPVVSLHARIGGFEQAMRRLIELPGFIPGRPPHGIDSDYAYDDATFAEFEATGRTYIQFIGDSAGRIGGAALQRRLVNALTRDCPVVAIAQKAESIPSEIRLAADIDLATGCLDYASIRSMVETLHGAAGIAAFEQWPQAYDVHYLTIEDVVLAFRPGRSAPQVIAVLASLTERNRMAAIDGDDGDDEDGMQDPASKGGQKASTAKQRAASSEKTSSGNNGGAGSKRDKPSGAEVIQPEHAGEGESNRSPLVIEKLSGYGKAKAWALNLKADLADHRAGTLAWSQMSSKLLLSGAPGTGKTTFARALCNSLQIPLVVTSVSTWLQGGHLSDVIARMARTFAEALALAPAILFIDEIDGIGKRQPAEREYADYWNAVVNKALELLDGAVKSEGLVIVGATNRPDDIDEALKRSGRLETHIDIPKPGVAALAEIFAHHLGDDIAVLVGGAGAGNDTANEAQAENPLIARGGDSLLNDADGQADAHIEGNDVQKGART